tara:strand:- start:5136 stop:6344 length:1209 start_codon:yes stop_codon:yes gene_type:complete
MLINKYEPGSLEELKGNSKKVKRVLDFVKKFEKEKKNAVLVSGPNGVGKTILGKAIASELGLELFELNASDKRNTENLERVLGEAMKQGSLFFNGKLFLIDDIDAISGVQDRGSIKTLINLIEGSNYPLIITCNEHKIEKLDPLRKKCLIVEFSKLDVEEIFSLLEEVCSKEGIVFENGDLRKIARYCNGDMRAALNDLQSYVVENKLILDGFEPRVLKEEMEEMLVKLFKGSSFGLALKSLEGLKAPLFDYGPKSLVVFGSPDVGVYWIEENLRKEFSSNLSEAYDLVGESDKFYGRIIKRQHWRYLVYCSALLAGISTIEKGENGAVKYSSSSRSPKKNFRLWGLVSKRKSVVSGKIGLDIHASKSKVMKEVLPYVKLMSRKGVEFDFNLEMAESDWLKT